MSVEAKAGLPPEDVQGSTPRTGERRVRTECGEQAREDGGQDGRVWGAEKEREKQAVWPRGRGLRGVPASRGSRGPSLAGPESSPTGKAEAQEAIEQVLTGCLVQARVRGTLIGLHFAEPPFQACGRRRVRSGPSQGPLGFLPGIPALRSSSALDCRVKPSAACLSCAEEP